MILDWIDARIGLTNTMLRPVPEHTLNPSYWLGALMVVGFLIQGLTGALMLIYYVPTPSQAYSTTVFIIGNVPLGQLIETVHLYSAYAIVLLAFMHLMRGYFVGVHKTPRELMWIVGMLMGLVVLSFALTGYLLPWTVVSKSATDVTVGMLSLLPWRLGETLRFLVAGLGSDAAELLRFYDLHILVLPLVFLFLLGAKVYMFEIHGSPEPATGPPSRNGKIPWFPDAFWYMSILGLEFVAFLVALSVLFPLSLSPEFTATAAAGSVPQPEWYFLAIYQVLKFSAFEGSGIDYALGGVTVLLLILILLPFLDRGRERNPLRRPIFVTLGVVFTAEIIVLTVWGYLTPGQVIPDWEAVAVTGATALVVCLISWFAYKVRGYKRSHSTMPLSEDSSSGLGLYPSLRCCGLTTIFLLLLVVCSIALADLVNVMHNTQRDPSILGLIVPVIGFSFWSMSKIVERLAPVRVAEVHAS